MQLDFLAYKKSIIAATLMTMLVSFPGCKKFIEVDPPINQFVGDVVFTNDATATAAITGIYSEMMKTGSQFCTDYTSLLGGLASDELYYYSPGFRDEFFNNQLTLTNHGLLSLSFWQPAYRYIYSANICIEKIGNSTALSSATKLQLIGEAKFIRAFCYFYLVNLFCDVPLITSSDYTSTAFLPRSSSSLIYAQMIKDLTEASQLLSVNYASSEKIRPNKWTAQALLARAYLFQKDWGNAETISSAVINSGQYQLDTDLHAVFQTSSKEAIWQLRPVVPSKTTWEGYDIIPSSVNSVPTYLVSSGLLNSFEIGDLRKTKWITARMFSGQQFYYPYKYKIYGSSTPLSEYYLVFRLAEQYLIRAEGRAQQNKIPEALNDINLVRSRAGLLPITATNSASLLSAIEQERKIELFAEWGHRWFDLKRTGRADVILGILKPSWQSNAQLWPIPNDQLKANPALTQNPGY